MADEDVHMGGRGRAVQVEKRRYLPVTRTRHRNYDSGVFEFLSNRPLSLALQIIYTIVVSVILFVMMNEMQAELDNLNYQISDEQVNSKFQNFKSIYQGFLWWGVVVMIAGTILYNLINRGRVDAYLTLLLFAYYAFSNFIISRYQLSLQIRLRRF